MYWIYDIPHWLGAVLFSAVFVGATGLGIVLARPGVRRLIADQPDWNGVMGYVISAFGVYYGITLALIAVSAYQNFAQADQTVGREAVALATLYRDVSSYPLPIREPLQTALRAYTRGVVEEDWPVQQRGDVPEGGTAQTTAFQERLLSFAPRTRAQEILHAETLRQFSSFVEYRRQRLQSVSLRLPPVLWVVVATGAVINMVLTWLFGINRLAVHLLVGGLLSLFVAQLVFLTVAMDNPFRGELSITPEAFVTVQRSLMELGR